MSGEDLKRLEASAAIEGFSIALMTGAGERETVLEHVIHGNSRQAQDRPS